MKKLFISLFIIFICLFGINVYASELDNIHNEITIDSSSDCAFKFINSYKSLEVGKMIKLEYSNSDLVGDVTFSSSNPEIATVSSDGVVVGVSKGITTITGEILGYSSQVLVSVDYYNGFDIYNEINDINYDDIYNDGVDYVIIPVGDNFIDNINRAILSNLNIMISYKSTGDYLFDSNYVNSYLNDNIYDFISKYSLPFIYYCDDFEVSSGFISNCSFNVIVKTDINNIDLENDSSDNYYVINRDNFDITSNNFIMYDYLNDKSYSHSILSMNYLFLPTIHEEYEEKIEEVIINKEDNYTYYDDYSYYSNNNVLNNSYLNDNVINIDKLSTYNSEFKVIKYDEVYNGRDISIRIDADYSLFDGYVYVDDILLSSSDFDSHSGSTVIVIKSKFINSLNSGNHIVKVMFKNDNYAISKFYVKKKSEVVVKNNDLSIRLRGVIIPIALIIILIIGIRLVILQKKILKK